MNIKKIFQSLNLNNNKLINAKTDDPTHEDHIVNRKFVDSKTIYNTAKALEFVNPFKLDWVTNPVNKTFLEIFDDVFFPQLNPEYFNPIFKSFIITKNDPNIIFINTTNVGFKIKWEISQSDRFLNQAPVIAITKTDNSIININTESTALSGELSFNIDWTNILKIEFVAVFNPTTLIKQDTYGNDYVPSDFQTIYTLKYNILAELSANNIITPALFYRKIQPSENVEDIVDSTAVLNTSNQLINTMGYTRTNKNLIVTPGIENFFVLLVPKLVYDEYLMFIGGDNIPASVLTRNELMTVDGVQFYLNTMDLGHYTSQSILEIKFKQKLGTLDDMLLENYYLLNDLGKISAIYLDIVNNLIDGGVDKILSAEQGKVLAERVSVLEVKSIADDFYIAGLLESSKLLYHTDIFREIDLQPYVGITIVNTNEIVRNGNDIFVVGNYSFDNTLTPFIVSLINCRTRNNVLIFDSSNFTTLSLPIHGLIFHNGFLFSATRTTTTNINKINPYDFTDIRTLSLPNDATYGGQTTDILGYKDKLYVLCTTASYQTSKFIEISENLIQYRVVFNIPHTSSYWTGGTSPFLIYNDELYIPFRQSGDFIAIRVYDLQGNIKRERTGIPILSTVSGGTIAQAHWMGIFNNKLLITHTYRKSLIRLDCTTLASEETIALATSVTDDNSITKDGYLLLNGEENPWDLSSPAQLIKVKYNNFLDYNILLQGSSFNNGKGSPGSINNKINVSGLNLSAKKDNVLTKTSDYTIVMSDFANNNILIVYTNATTANMIITLPLAAATAGYKIKVIKTDNSANTVTVKGNGSQLINGANTFVLSTQFSNVEINSNGTQNYIL